MSTANPSADRASALEAGRWKLDLAQSHAEFRVRHTWGLATVKGYLAPLEGWLTISQDHVWLMELTLDATSVSSGNRMRDKDLRSAKFFDVERHPTVQFRSTSVSLRQRGALVTGELTAGATTVTITPETTIEFHGDELRIDAEVTLDQRELGMTHSPLGMVRTPSVLRVRAVLLPHS